MKFAFACLCMFMVSEGALAGVSRDQRDRCCWKSLTFAFVTR